MKKFNAICTALFLTIPSTMFAQTVSVTGGQVHGALLEGGGAVFRGIPYAAPPVGDLRWREPAPVRHWAGVREATAFSAQCAQAQISIPPTLASSEDCLYLNVWTPEWPNGSRKPVMVWIHGGGNVGGTASDPIFDSDSLTRHGVVLVTLNYRVGPFGFFSHPALTRESPRHTSGNQGILDQIAALKWVQQNIARFGGDPDNVTVFGESAAGFDIGLLMTSPLSKDLFKRAIEQSGPVTVSETILGKPDTLAQAEKRGETSAIRWKLSAGASAKELRKLSTQDILIAEPNYFRSGPDYKAATMVESFPAGGLVIDGYVARESPRESFAAGHQHPLALLLGSNFRDWVPGTRPPADLAAAIDDIFGPLGARARALYIGERDALYGTPAQQLVTDAGFRCGSVGQLIWHASAGNTAYQFEFAHPTTGRESAGNNHAAEVSYVFGTINKKLFAIPGPAPTPGPVDAQVSDMMQRYWTNFAKTGDPNGPELPVWPKFTPDMHSYIQFTSAGPVAKEGLRRPYCDLYIENVERQMQK
jgi:para-nitrobenzyl esterase